VTYSKTVLASGMSGETLVVRFRAFGVNGLSANNLTITSEDKDNGIIYLSSTFPITQTFGGIVSGNGQMDFIGAIVVSN
jgi:hypothetical protein